MRSIYLALSLLTINLFLLSGCKQSSGDSSDTHEHDHDHEAPAPGEIVLSEAQVQMAGIVLGRVSRQSIAEGITANGFTTVPPQRKASVSTPLGGLVQSILIKEGGAVRKGQVLAVLENLEWISLQQQYLEDRAQLGYTEQELQRQQTLSEGQAGALKSLQKAEADQRALKARVAATESKLKLLGIDQAALDRGEIANAMQVKAPISGHILSIHVNIGSFVNANEPLFEIVNADDIHLDLGVYERDLPRVRIGQQVRFQLVNQPGPPLMAEIFSIGKALDPQTRTADAHCHILTGGGQLLPGMPVRATIQLSPEKTEALPREAIVREGEQEYIFVLLRKSEAGWAFRKVALRSSGSDEHYAAITTAEQLPPDAEIAVKGAYFISAQGRVEEAGQDHDHG